MATVAAQAAHPGYLDDEITALTLQLEEFNYREETKKAKYPVNDIPDLEVAYASYLNEIEAHLSFLRDVKLAHSIANAVDTDAQAIAEATQENQQAQDDHSMAVQMSAEDPELEAPPPYTQEGRTDFIEDEVVRRLAALLTSDDDIYGPPQSDAGPSISYQRQAVALDKLAQEAHQCVGCTDEFRWADITHLKCDHKYCEACLKKFIMAPVVDRELALLPPRCCDTAVPFPVIVRTLTEAELDEFQHAELEKATRDKTYFANAAPNSVTDVELNGQPLVNAAAPSGLRAI
ncbi:hypothetical protein E8E12_002561 [Didymella heteroderae]|uniref:RING-type domain-containing protein n=1 Tax=Didymella heteroderae TaxID=1769908 RepID=A0A9P5BVN2_9PLEO|nr:hypothetical protein E8E12_002561 [Didymella heteroderae]